MFLHIHMCAYLSLSLSLHIYIYVHLSCALNIHTYIYAHTSIYIYMYVKRFMDMHTCQQHNANKKQANRRRALGPGPCGSATKRFVPSWRSCCRRLRATGTSYYTQQAPLRIQHTKRSESGTMKAGSVILNVFLMVRNYKALEGPQKLVCPLGPNMELYNINLRVASMCPSCRALLLNYKRIG